ncbi:MAG TPA: hypothetical protein DHU33_04490 [Firmicutes bacterium]|nr:hypothetical protein [Bacillota bacterium]
MKENINYTTILNKIFTVLVVIAIILGVNLLFTMISLTNGGSSSDNSSNSSTSGTQTSSDYDVSDFDTLTLAQVLKLFDSKDTSVLYLGRSSCSACVSFLPTLKSVQKDLGFKTKYLDITTVDTSSSDYSTFISKLTKEIEVNANGTKSTGKISEFYGYTPMVIIIKDGKAANASVGALSESNFKKFLSSNGIK